MQTRNKLEICNGNSISMVNIFYYEMQNEFTVRDESMLTKCHLNIKSTFYTESKLNKGPGWLIELGSINTA